MNAPFALSALLFGALLFPPRIFGASERLPTPPTLPQRIYALPGKPCVIRFDALIYTPQEGSLLFDVESGPGAQQVGRWVWHVKPDGKPVPPLQVGVYSGASFEPLANLRSEVAAVDPAGITQRGDLRWLAIGDSLTLPGHYITQSITTLQKELPGITLKTVGTTHPKDAPTLLHEGRGGWSWVRYLEAKESPFVFPPGHFDFARYLREKLNGSPPDLITLFLGANDVYGISAQYAPEKISLLQERAKTLVAAIRSAAPQSAIGIVIPPPPSDQNGFGTNYPTGVTEWQYRRAMQHYSAALLAAFDGRWDENIHIIPAHLAFDPDSAYPMAGSRAQNALHPTAKGFEPISNAIAAWIVHLLASGKVTAR